MVHCYVYKKLVSSNPAWGYENTYNDIVGILLLFLSLMYIIT